MIYILTDAVLSQSYFLCSQSCFPVETKAQVELQPQRSGARAKYIACHRQIIPVILGDEATALSASEQLLDRGFLIPAIRPPTVPKGTARLRISVMCDHTQEQLQDLVDALADIRGEPKS